MSQSRMRIMCPVPIINAIPKGFRDDARSLLHALAFLSVVLRMEICLEVIQKRNRKSCQSLSHQTLDPLDLSESKIVQAMSNPGL